MSTTPTDTRLTRKVVVVKRSIVRRAKKCESNDATPTPRLPSPEIPISSQTRGSSTRKILVSPKNPTPRLNGSSVKCKYGLHSTLDTTADLLDAVEAAGVYDPTRYLDLSAISPAPSPAAYIDAYPPAPQYLRPRPVLDVSSDSRSSADTAPRVVVAPPPHYSAQPSALLSSLSQAVPDAHLAGHLPPQLPPSAPATAPSPSPGAGTVGVASATAAAASAILGATAAISRLRVTMAAADSYIARGEAALSGTAAAAGGVAVPSTCTSTVTHGVSPSHTPREARTRAITAVATAPWRDCSVASTASSADGAAPRAAHYVPHAKAAAAPPAGHLRGATVSLPRAPLPLPSSPPSSARASADGACTVADRWQPAYPHPHHHHHHHHCQQQHAPSTVTKVPHGVVGGDHTAPFGHRAATGAAPVGAGRIDTARGSALVDVVAHMCAARARGVVVSGALCDAVTAGVAAVPQAVLARAGAAAVAVGTDAVQAAIAAAVADALRALPPGALAALVHTEDHMLDLSGGSGVGSGVCVHPHLMHHGHPADHASSLPHVAARDPRLSCAADAPASSAASAICSSAGAHDLPSRIWDSGYHYHGNPSDSTSGSPEHDASAPSGDREILAHSDDGDSLSRHSTSAAASSCGSVDVSAMGPPVPRASHDHQYTPHLGVASPTHPHMRHHKPPNQKTAGVSHANASTCSSRCSDLEAVASAVLSSGGPYRNEPRVEASRLWSSYGEDDFC